MAKVRLTFNVETEEMVGSSFEGLSANAGLSLRKTEQMVSLGLATAKEIHKMLLK